MARLPLDIDDSSISQVVNAGAFVIDAVDALDKPFDDQLGRGDGKFLSVSFEPTRDVPIQIGTERSVRLTLGHTSDLVLDIIWPDEEPEQRALLEEYAVEAGSDEQLYLLFSASGTASVGAGLRFPSGPLSSTMGIEAGGSVVYTHLKPFQRQDPAGEVLRGLVTSLKLPHAVSTAEDIPAEGEVIAFRCGGYIDMTLGTTWGYSVQKYRGSGLGALELKQRVDIASSVQLSTSIRVAGTHRLEVRRGSAPDWLRITVRKHGEKQFTAAADIDVRATVETDGLPSDADQFLLSLLNLQTPDVVGEVRTVIDGGVEAVAERLNAEAQDLVDRLLDHLYSEWFDGGPTEENVERYFERLKQVTDAYRSVREIDERAIGVLEQYARDEEKLRRLIVRVLSVPDRVGLEEITETEVWEFLQQYLGDQFYAFLTNDRTFETVQEQLASWKERGWEHLMTFMAARQDCFDLRELFKEIDTLLQELDAAERPEDVLATAEMYLLQLTERLLGKQLDKLSGTALNEALDELNAVLNRMSAFKTELYDQFVAALNRTHTLDLSVSYRRAEDSDALIDVEINIEREPELVEAALCGDFSALADIDDPERVIIHPCLFTNRIRTTSQLKIDVLGLRYEWMRELIFSTRERIRQQGDGLVHVYEMEAAEEINRRRRDEEVKMQFILGLLAEGRRPQLIDTVSRLSADYSFDVTDPQTSDRELRAYLQLGRYLQLLPEDDIDTLLHDFRRELGLGPDEPWGQVQVNYHVRYDPEVLLNIFRLLPQASLNGITREAFRTLTAANYRNFGGAQYEAVAALIQEQAMYLTWKTAREELHLNVDRTHCYRVEGASEPVCIDRFRRKVLDILYEVEDDLVSAFLELDGVLDEAWSAGARPNRKELESAFRRFAEQRRTLEKWTTIRREDRYVSPLFAILDKHISVVSDGKGSRSVLEIVFRPGGEATVRKVFVT